ncbi:MAG: 30S ribosomal protein S17 [Verrucomicrobia bacterium]|jgi:small subunit ribosomal protein S17|nr:30S ribosomal protein S17 [Verrucomicrobiota bacterium]
MTVEISSGCGDQRGTRKKRRGRVVSAKMRKTIVVQVERRVRHPEFKKVVTRFKKLYVHDEDNLAKVGDRVVVEETRPLSRLKKWRLVEVIGKKAASETAGVLQEGV